MPDAEAVLREQISGWEERAQEARDVLRVADEVLPRLKESLAALKGSEVSEIVSPGPGAPAAEEEAEGYSSSAEERISVKKGEDVQAAVAEILPTLPRRFDQSHIDSALEATGKAVNRSTLRSNLLLMAKTQQGFEVAVPGRGRKATIFERI